MSTQRRIPAPQLQVLAPPQTVLAWLRAQLAQATSTGDVRLAVQEAMRFGIDADSAWATVAYFSRVMDPDLIDTIYEMCETGIAFDGLARNITGAAHGSDRLIQLAERELLSKISSYTTAAANALIALGSRQLILQATHPQVVRNLLSIVRSCAPSPASEDAAAALTGVTDLHPDILVELDPHLARRPEARARLTRHVRADCRVWNAQLSHPTAEVLSAMGDVLVPPEFCPDASQAPVRDWRLRHRCGPRRCKVELRGEELTLQNYPELLGPYCMRARGKNFRRLFVALAGADAAGSDGAARVFLEATPGQRRALRSTDLTPILDIANGAMRTAIMGQLDGVRPGRSRSPSPTRTPRRTP